MELDANIACRIGQWVRYQPDIFGCRDLHDYSYFCKRMYRNYYRHVKCSGTTHV